MHCVSTLPTCRVAVLHRRPGVAAHVQGAPLARVLAAVSSSPAHTKAKMAVLGHLMGEAHGSAILAANTAVVPRLWRYLQQDVLPDLQVRGRTGRPCTCLL